MRIGLLSLAGAMALHAGAAMAQDAPADLILSGGAVYTPDGWAEAVAVRDGAIAAVGDDAAVLRLRGAETKTISLDGATVLPGLNDSHAHPFIGGVRQLAPCRVPQAPATAVVEALAGCVRTLPPGEWLMVGPSFLAGLSRHELDAVAPANPVIVQAPGGHDVVVNSLALAAAGIDRTTQPPPGGVIVHDEAGEPTGQASDLGNMIYDLLTPPSPDISRRGAGNALQTMRAAGVTSVTDANYIPVSALPAFAALADAGELKMRVRGCYNWEFADDVQAVIDTLLSGTYDRELFDPRCVKIFVDGTSGPTRTAALLDPYVPRDGTFTEDKGALLVPQDALNEAVMRFDKAGLMVLFHAWGDAAVVASLTAIEAARTANGPAGARHQIGHALLIRASDLPRAKAVGAVFEFSATPNPLVLTLMGGEIGAERMARAAPVREVLEAGVAAVGGTDWSVPPPAYNPWAMIEVLATRPAPRSTAERVTLEQAVAMWTSYPALISADPTAPGIIAQGRKADLVVLNQNPFNVPSADISTTQTKMTILGGEIVWEAPPAP